MRCSPFFGFENNRILHTYNKEGKGLNERNYAKRPDRNYLYSSRQH